MLLTHIDLKSEEFNLRPVSLRTVLQHAQDKVALYAECHSVALIIAPMTGDMVVADEYLLERALSSLLETAVKFSVEGEPVHISYDGRELVFDTTGKNIPDALLPKFFDLFALGEASTAAGDIGLGPAVACRILALFAASTTVANRTPSGIRLTTALAEGKNHSDASEYPRQAYRKARLASY